MIENEIELKVCKSCDAPLPFKPEKLSFYTNSFTICDDCFNLNNED